LGLDEAAEGFFVYGSLRPDDNSAAAWTQDFCLGLHAERAELPGASLYIESYAAVCLEQTRCSVRGVFLVPDAQTSFRMKLKEADRIEGYPDLYDRTVVSVRIADGTFHRAVVYHRTGRVDRDACQRVADGDWLSRPRICAST